jgi:hypothetical protein
MSRLAALKRQGNVMASRLTKAGKTVAARGTTLAAGANGRKVGTLTVLTKDSAEAKAHSQAFAKGISDSIKRDKDGNVHMVLPQLDGTCYASDKVFTMGHANIVFTDSVLGRKVRVSVLVMSNPETAEEVALFPARAPKSAANTRMI